MEACQEVAASVVVVSMGASAGFFLMVLGAGVEVVNSQASVQVATAKAAFVEVEPMVKG